MKFQCEKCSTGYSVPDEKVRGKRVRIQCKRCSHPIILEGPPAAAKEPDPRPRGPAGTPARSRQKTQIGGLTAPAVPPGNAAPAPDRSSRGRTAAPEDLWTVALSRDNPQKMTTSDLVDAVRAKLVTPNTLVWKKGMADWKPPFEVPLIAMALRAAGLDAEPPPTPPPGQALSLPDPLAPAGALSGVEDLAGFEEDGEATTVLDRDQVNRLVGAERRRADQVRLSGRAPPKPSRPSSRARKPTSAPALAQPALASAPHAFDFDDEITEIVAPEDSLRYLQQSGVLDGATAASEPDRISGFDDDDITRRATAEAAQELLRKSAAAAGDEDAASDEPSVVVSADSDGGSSPATSPARSRYNPVHAQIQNEPTRIIRVRKKPKRGALWLGFLVVLAASAVGGFLASRYLASPPPQAPHGP